MSRQDVGSRAPAPGELRRATSGACSQSSARLATCRWLSLLTLVVMQKLPRPASWLQHYSTRYSIRRDPLISDILLAQALPRNVRLDREQKLH